MFINKLTSVISGLRHTVGNTTGRRYIGGMTPLSDGTPAYIRIHFIFLASRIIGLHFATNDIGLHSFKFFWCAP